jgi:hypothetical protein
MTTIRWAFALLAVFLILSPIVGATNVNPLYQDKSRGGSNPLYESGNFAAAPGGAGGLVDLAFVSGNDLMTLPAGGNVPLTINGSGFDVRAIGPVSVGGGHVYLFGGATQGNVRGIYTMPVNGGFPGTIRSDTDGVGSDASRAPVISTGQNPLVGFNAPDATGTTNFYVATRTGGIYLTVNGSNFSQVSRRGLNHWGDRAEVATEVGSTQSKLYVTPGTGGITGTIPIDPSLRLTTSQPRIIDNEKRSVFFTAINSTTGTAGLFHSDKFIPQGIDYRPPTLMSSGIDLNAAFSVSQLEPGSVGGSSVIIGWLSKRGYDYYRAQGDFSTAGGLESITETRLIGAGDTVGGLTVADVIGSESSLQPNGDAILLLSFTDGSAGIYQIQVPEPTALLMLAGVVPFLARRRARAWHQESPATGRGLRR